jgi:hypothetical protein
VSGRGARGSGAWPVLVPALAGWAGTATGAFRQARHAGLTPAGAYLQAGAACAILVLAVAMLLVPMADRRRAGQTLVGLVAMLGVVSGYGAYLDFAYRPLGPAVAALAAAPWCAAAATRYLATCPPTPTYSNRERRVHSAAAPAPAPPGGSVPRRGGRRRRRPGMRPAGMPPGWDALARPQRRQPRCRGPVAVAVAGTAALRDAGPVRQGEDRGENPIRINARPPRISQPCTSSTPQPRRLPQPQSRTRRPLPPTGRRLAGTLNRPHDTRTRSIAQLRNYDDRVSRVPR